VVLFENEMVKYTVRQRPAWRPSYPGELLRDEILPALHLTVKGAAANLGVSRQNDFRTGSLIEDQTWIRRRRHASNRWIVRSRADERMRWQELNDRLYAGLNATGAKRRMP
jgi:hypothetical protein